MAQVTKNVKVIVPAVAEVSEITYLIELTSDEASAVRALIGQVGMADDITDDLYHAMSRAKVPVKYRVVNNMGEPARTLVLKEK
jgi:hypothetical protein